MAVAALAGGCWSRRHVSNWIDSGGDVPPLGTHDNREKQDRRHARRLRVLLTIGIAVLLLTLGSRLGYAHDPSHPELKAWFESLKSGKGPCCSGADGTAVSDVDWQSAQWPLSRTARWRMERCTRR